MWTGLVDPKRLLCNHSARPGLPITLTQLLGVGVLNSRHEATGEAFRQAIACMVELNGHTAESALATTATDVTGFGLLGHLVKMVRASGVQDSWCATNVERGLIM